MRKVNEIAEYLIQSYETITNTKFDNNELLLQKLMYFAQKTSLAFTGKPLFEETFEGWIHGPVLPQLRYYFEFINHSKELELTETEKYIIDNTVYNYGQYAPWRLRDLTHEEYSWKKSREGLEPHEYGNKVIQTEDIMKDAENIRLYDHLYDMYIDEFEDIEEGDFISAS